MKKNLMAALLSIVGACVGCNASDITNVGPLEFQNQIAASSNSAVLDVRTPEEYNEGHLADAENLDVTNSKEFDAGLQKLDKSRHYFVYCRSGRRSMKACEIMKSQGFDVTNLKGGIIAWEKDNLPIVE